MTQVFKDYTEIKKDPAKVAEIADTIRHAKLGSEVREAMAQGFETIDDSEVVKHLISDVDDLKDKIIGYRADVKKLTETVEKSITDNKTNIENVGKENREVLKKFDEDWQAKINRIILGTDEPTLDRIIDEKLNERGV
jgi:predicted  nucleic acid-binding Zn-ribbon protein